jgi:hypothetical protein
VPINWVVVNSDGTIRRQSGGVTVSRTTTGQYTITWPTAVANCSLAVTLSSDNAGGPPPNVNTGEALAFGPEGGTGLGSTQSAVQTRDDVGGFADRGFNAQEVC